MNTPMSDLCLLSVTQLTTGFASGEISPVDATQAALAAVERHDADVNAMVLLDPGAALESARAAERRWRDSRPLGPVDGVPTTIEDILLTRGWPTLRGSNLVSADGPWTEDAPASRGCAKRAAC